MDRGAWRATVYGAARVGYDLVTSPQKWYKWVLFSSLWLIKYLKSLTLPYSKENKQRQGENCQGERLALSPWEQVSCSLWKSGLQTWLLSMMRLSLKWNLLLLCVYCPPVLLSPLKWRFASLFLLYLSLPVSCSNAPHPPTPVMWLQNDGRLSGPAHLHWTNSDFIRTSPLPYLPFLWGESLFPVSQMQDLGITRGAASCMTV